jgi:hypothetical protein
MLDFGIFEDLSFALPIVGSAVILIFLFRQFLTKLPNLSLTT